MKLETFTEMRNTEGETGMGDGLHSFTEHVEFQKSVKQLSEDMKEVVEYAK